MSRTYRSSRPCNFVSPRQPLDASMRFRVHGPVLPMEEEGSGLPMTWKAGALGLAVFAVLMANAAWGLA